MSGNENQHSTIANNLCKNGCGFYGSTQFDGMCSVCYKENLKKKQKQDDEQIIMQKPASAVAAAAALSASSSGASLPVTPSSTSLLMDTPTAAVDADVQEASAAAAAAAEEESSSDLQQSDSPLLSQASPIAMAAAAAEAIDMPLSVGAGAAANSSAEFTDAAASQASGKPHQQTQRNRCGVCKKKIGLTGFDCRCGGVYCSAHRYSDKHACSFDYQSHGQELIRKANPQVVSSKVDKL